MNIEYSRQSIHAINDFPPEARDQFKSIVKIIKEHGDFRSIPNCKQLAGVPHGYRIDMASYRLVLVHENTSETVFLQLILPEVAVKEKEEELKAQRTIVIRERKTISWMLSKATKTLVAAAKACVKAIKSIGERLPKVEIRITRKAPKTALLSESDHS